MGSFDEVLRQQMRAAGGNLGHGDTDGGMNARDLAARQMNVAQGRGMSTAWPGQPQQVQQQPPQQQLPQGGPIPSSRPMSNVDQSIAQQLPENGPIPAPRMAEQMGPPMPPQQGNPVDESIAATTGDAPQGGPGADAQGQTATPDDMSPLMGFISGVGGMSMVKLLLERFKAGDPEAAEAFSSNGIKPEEAEMAARMSTGSEVTPYDPGMSGTPDGNNPDGPRLQGPNTPRLVSPDQRMSDDLYPRLIEGTVYSPEEPSVKQIEGPKVETKTGRGAKNQPNSRPKAKPKIKPKT